LPQAHIGTARMVSGASPMGFQHGRGPTTVRGCTESGPFDRRLGAGFRRVRFYGTASFARARPQIQVAERI
jgi:hypothetical protein